MSHKRAVIHAIFKKHDNATDHRRFNAILATSSIADAIEYYHFFKQHQREYSQVNEDFRPLNIACVFSPPAEGNKDIQQLQDDLQQEKADNEIEPGKKKAALTQIMADYNAQYGTNHSIAEFDGYYQDIQQRIKSQKYPNKDVPRKDKIDVIIVVDMLLTGFDSKFLNTIYVDKNLKYHGLIQAFSRTNRVINDNKPKGNILDFRQQEDAVDNAMVLFSGAQIERAKEIWLVEPAPVVIEKYQEAVGNLKTFMESHGLECEAHEVDNLKGDEARAQFINTFKEVQRLKTQLNQYTHLEDAEADTIEATLPTDDFRSFKSNYLDTAKRLKEIQNKPNTPDAVNELDFEFSLFSSSVVDYDYIIGLLAKNLHNQPSEKTKMTKEQIIQLLSASANMQDEREDIIAYINAMPIGEKLTEKEMREGYQQFKDEKAAKELKAIATKHGLETQSLKAFIDEILYRMLFDGEKLTDLLAPLELGWKDRRVAELALMEDLIPFLNRLAEGREIAGLNAYTV